MTSRGMYDVLNGEYIGGTVGQMYAAAAGYPIVDAVFTYVNGSEPHFRAQLANFTKLPEESGYRDFGQLRYGMRSVLQYAPWVRNIILVVSSQRQVPLWLDVNHPKIRVVEHREIWEDPSQLPSFSSHQIEWNLHSIFEVAPNILYFNDDMALTMPLLPKQLWTVTGEPLLHEDWIAPNNASTEVNAFGKSLAYVHNLFDQHYGKQNLRRAAAHGPFLFNTTIMKMIREEWKEEFDRMYCSSRFRTDHDMQFQFAYQQYIRSKKDGNGRPVVPFGNSSYSEYYYIKRISDNPALNLLAFQKIKSVPRQFICLQDNIKQPALILQEDARKFRERKKSTELSVFKSVIQFYEGLFPAKAPWEL
eukprot:CAMPEP_0113529730 /NCGR_PEP_ID=MMETSP0015_2-20120614/2552_1 /TAXON_ID=2838 /ORGANISM="Odontella" /LENGTH=360 /DNA_ID=CAMNT_0000428385 /DNA_START=306 /DNA_END=1388 /DNA_ORIENTATION=+ /assembly_acc=CAM_ASM_000160